MKYDNNVCLISNMGLTKRRAEEGDMDSFSIKFDTYVSLYT